MLETAFRFFILSKILCKINCVFLHFQVYFVNHTFRGFRLLQILPSIRFFQIRTLLIYRKSFIPAFCRNNTTQRQNPSQNVTYSRFLFLPVRMLRRKRHIRYSRRNLLRKNRRKIPGFFDGTPNILSFFVAWLLFCTSYTRFLLGLTVYRNVWRTF